MDKNLIKVHRSCCPFSFDLFFFHPLTYPTLLSKDNGTMDGPVLFFYFTSVPPPPRKNCVPPFSIFYSYSLGFF